MTVDDLEIPPNATIRQEHVKCGNPDYQNLHGPYFYAYWKHDKKLNKSKNFEDFASRKIAKEAKLRPSQYTKFIFIQEEADKGNLLAKEYLEKLRNESVTIDWVRSLVIVAHQ